MSFTVDSQPGGATSPVGEARKPDLRVKLLRLYIIFAVPILAGALFFGLMLKDRLERDARLSDLSVTQSVIVSREQREAQRATTKLYRQRKNASISPEERQAQRAKS